mmetsp:Transcript_12324/g.18818  ORF Transcript_12324/g.18818 Transcript_12324/m.18818 type:complete len:183 (-) Transcript_12324:63-611(-)
MDESHPFPFDFDWNPDSEADIKDFPPQPHRGESDIMPAALHGNFGQEPSPAASSDPAMMGQTKPADFSEAFRELMRAFKEVNVTERKKYVAEAALPIMTKDRAGLAELHDVIASQGFGRHIGSLTTDETTPQSGLKRKSSQMDPGVCRCGDCPYRPQLEKIEGFLADVFSNNGGGNIMEDNL